MKIYTNLQKITISESLNLNSFEGELWRPISEFEGAYEVSNYARVKSLKRTVKTTKLNTRLVREKILKQRFDRDGYKRVTLSLFGLYKNKCVHRMVAFAFIENTLSKSHVNHIKEIKNLNWFDEVNWMTPTENNNYGLKIEKTKKALFNGKLSKAIVQLTIEGDFVKEWISASDASRNGFLRKSISNCALNKVNTHKGFRWVFKKNYAV